ncbi:hypothetical protein M758_9G184100 [Ceratodon purpureus]|uniref:Uncharacterized protein n=1 Tax=Ceratodon purpureus TaxID=3225 RepID=A0A8T0GVQ6_CERPU|nr:hypothetical protein KC19_9G187100 [Ceratodon purpureus]KAG0606989.1 hypothetical protein M758_9G184100 [Ceratodon purpureus]
MESFKTQYTTFRFMLLNSLILPGTMTEPVLSSTWAATFDDVGTVCTSDL